MSVRNLLDGRVPWVTRVLAGRADGPEDVR